MRDSMKLRKAKEGDRSQLREIANKYLAPIYGNQDKALNEWITGEGYKTVFVLEVANQIADLLSLKRNPSKNYVKISTLLVVHEFQKNKLGNLLLTRSVEFAREEKVNRLVVTVSETVPDSVIFFLKNGFNILHCETGKYKRGVVEFIMERGL